MQKSLHIMAGDWYCDSCKGDEAKTGFKYFWESELPAPKPLLEKLFPIMNSNVFRAIPWGAIQASEEQAMRNHSQTLARLAERGGLSPCEAVAVLEGKAYYDRWPSSYTAQQGLEADTKLLAIVSRYTTQHQAS